MPAPSPRSSPTRSEVSCHLEQEQKQRTRVRTPLSAPAPFFIIQESSLSSITSPTGSPPKLRRDADDGSPSARHEKGSKKKKARGKTPAKSPLAQFVRGNADSRNKTSSPLRASSAKSSVEEEAEAEADEDTIKVVVKVQAKKIRPAELSILNRCGSAPDLPLHSSVSSSVFSSTKKRTLQGGANGASPHLASLQRSRLTPLPIRTRTIAKLDPLLDSRDESNTNSDEHDVMRVCKDPALQERLEQDSETIAALKQRLVLSERDISVSTKHRNAMEKQIAQLTHDNNRLQSEKTLQQARIGELEKTALRQRHEFDKLAARYTAVYTNLQKLAERQQFGPDKSAMQTALQALARENQDFLRKLRVLEARHAEDKTLTSNQEKKIKRLKAEKEALQHMNEAKTREEDMEETASEMQQHSPTTDHSSRLKNKRRDIDNNHGGRPSSASSSSSLASPTPRSQTRPGSSTRLQVLPSSAQGAVSHLVAADVYQYIDPSILKVLEKVDSQFSITNAINLSAVLKKWLNSCVHVVCSTHLPTVLQTLLKRTCELLHCDHAALFTVDYSSRKLVGVCSERGAKRWELPLDKGISGYAVRHNMICNVQRASDDPRFFSPTDSITSTMSREVLALPIVHELQHHVEAHLLGGSDSSRTNLRGLGVFAVLRVWNTTHQKPFSTNDQILATLLSIQAGIVLRQTAVTKTLQKINHKVHLILHMPSEIIIKATNATQASEKLRPSSESIPKPAFASLSAPPAEYSAAATAPSVIQLVSIAQKELAECLGIRQLRIFVLDANALQLWHVGEQDRSGDHSIVARHYVKTQASLCSLVLRNESKPLVLKEPSSEASFNDTVDIPGGARGLYLAPISSPWGPESLPFGMIQVARVAKARLSSSPFALTSSETTGSDIIAGSVAEVAVNNEREAAQQTEDRLMLELLGLFCRVFAGLLHHVAGQQLYDTCPAEIQQAQLAFLAKRLESLATRHEADDNEVTDNQSIKSTDSPTSHESPRDTNSRRRTSSTVPQTLSSQNVRRVASADQKHRPPSAQRRDVTMSAGSPMKAPYPPRGMKNEVAQPWPDAGEQNDSDEYRGSPEVTEQAPESDGDISPGTENTQSVGAGLSVDVDVANHFNEAGILQEHDEIPTEQEMGEIPPEADSSYYYDPAVPTKSFYPAAENWDGTSYDQSFQDGGEGTWGDGGAYPTTWPDEGQDTYYEGAATWEYGDTAPSTAEDINAARGNTHISTNSSYAIDLGGELLSSRNTSSAESGVPNGEL